MYDACVIRGSGHRAAGVGCRAVALKPGGGREQIRVQLQAEELLFLSAPRCKELFGG